MTNIFRRYIV